MRCLLNVVCCLLWHVCMLLFVVWCLLRAVYYVMCVVFDCNSLYVVFGCFFACCLCELFCLLLVTCFCYFIDC